MQTIDKVLATCFMVGVVGFVALVVVSTYRNQYPTMIHAKSIVVGGWANDGGPVNCQLVITDKGGRRYQIIATDAQLLDAIESHVHQTKQWLQSQKALTQKGR